MREGKGGVKLSPVMEIGLAFYDGARLDSLFTSSGLSQTDINSRMPREEAEEIFNLIRPIGELNKPFDRYKSDSIASASTGS